MTKAWQIYYNALFGASGGLLAWLFLGLVHTSTWNIHAANLFLGAGIGLGIGGALGSVEGLLVKRSLGRAVLGSFLWAAAGLAGGMAGLFLGGLVFVFFQGGLVARMLGWMILGLFLGVGQGLVSLKFQRAAYGLVGGTLAGLCGGALYEIFTQLFLQQSRQAQQLLSAAGLILIGASLGSIIPMSVGIIGKVLAQRGLIVVETGPRANVEVEIIGSASLGSSDAEDIYLPDERIEKRQASIRKSANGFQITNLGSFEAVFVEQAALLPGQTASLPNRCRLVMGETHLRFSAQ